MGEQVSRAQTGGQGLPIFTHPPPTVTMLNSRLKRLETVTAVVGGAGGGSSQGCPIKVNLEVSVSCIVGGIFIPPF